MGYKRCKNTCHALKGGVLYGANSPNCGPYDQGFKRCVICGYIKWDGIYCPCCRYKLKTKSG